LPVRRPTHCVGCSVLSLLVGIASEAVRAIVTGGAGFIGSHVVDALLARGDDVVVVDDLSKGKRENVPEGAVLEVVDIREPLGDLFEGAEACFHLAAQANVRVSVERPDHDAEVNVLGTIQVLEAARRHGTQVVFASTGGAIYGECDGPAPEEAERRPLSPYGVSKLAGEEYLAGYNRLYGTRHVALRYGNVYGPRQDPHGEAGVVAIFLSRLAAGETPRIFGDGLQTRDYVYAGEVARATLAALGSDGVFNVGTGHETSVVELYELCRRVAGSEIEPEFADPRLGELQRSVLDVSRAEHVLGWRPEVSLEEGLRLTWEALS
jgi:UDP-glucose 4-epimerase